MQNVNPVIVNDHQRFVDDPVYKTIGQPRPLAQSINVLFQGWWVEQLRPKAIVYALACAYRGSFRRLPVLLRDLAPPNPPVHRIEEFSHHERVLLRWMKPDGNGGLIPKYEGS